MSTSKPSSKKRKGKHKHIHTSSTLTLSLPTNTNTMVDELQSSSDWSPYYTSNIRGSIILQPDDSSSSSSSNNHHENGSTSMIHGMLAIDSELLFHDDEDHDHDVDHNVKDDDKQHIMESIERW